MMTGIIIVSYHNAEGTHKYVLEQLSKLSDTYRVVVVAVDADEAYGRDLSHDCGLSYVDESLLVNNHPKGWCVSTVENLGYAKGNNLGVNVLKKSGLSFDNYLFSNDDVEIMNSNILDILSETMKKDSKCAGIGPRVISLDGSDQSPHEKYISPMRQIGWKLFSFLRKKQKDDINRKEKTVAELTQMHLQATTVEQTMKQSNKEASVVGSCYWVSGAFMMVDAKKFDAVGGFDSRTFLYFEEVILSERFKQQGWHFLFAPSVVVVHYEGGSTTVTNAKRNSFEMESRLLYYKEYMHENRILLKLYQWIC